MKVFVDGQAAVLDPKAANVAASGDRLVVKTDGSAATALSLRSGDAVLVSYRGRQYKIEKKLPRTGAVGVAASGEMRAPMPGLIVETFAQQGASVKKGDKILVLEAMKTQQAFHAPFDGTLTRLGVAKGDQVVDGALLALVSPATEP